ncbi:DPP IV N-terminal domain-containing protein [Chitinophaga solisilvae]|uniref:DPP IV N-terminal domain-containing protein n=1 Tax=Chitinophaga solisilvae TaxID=1233460 RepID=UPI00136DB72D|nr:DPP IV N-terminal domain-containing protein [Chitinophaga solisilvae]
MIRKAIYIIIIAIINGGCFQAAAQLPVQLRIAVREGTNMMAALSPDGRNIAIDLQGTLYLLPVTGGAAVQLTNGLSDDRQPSWSPDSRQLVFQSYRDGNYHLWLINADGSGLRQLTSGIYDDREPEWAADGRRILFSSDRSGKYDVWQLSLRDTTLQQVTNSHTENYQPALSPDSRLLAYVAGNSIRIRHRGQETVLVTSRGTVSAPAFTKDGKQVSWFGYEKGRSGLFLTTIATKVTRKLSASREDIFPFKVNWSKEKKFLYTADGKIRWGSAGSALADSVSFSVTLQLHRSAWPKKQRNFDDSAFRQVKGVMGPVVSPDGSTVAFTALGDIWLQEQDTVRRLTNDAAIDLDPAWSPDGSRLAFVSDRLGKMDLWIHDMITGTDKRITDTPEGVMFPAWSPDGQQIAFLLSDARNVWGTAVPGVVRPDTVQQLPAHNGPRTAFPVQPLAAVRRLHTPLSAPGRPAWSPDGQRIAFSVLQPFSSRFREGISKILLVAADGQQPDRFISPLLNRTLATRGKNGPVWSPDGKQMAYVQNGVLWTVPVQPDGTPAGPPRQLTATLADAPSWTGDAKSIVFWQTDKLQQVFLSDGHIIDRPLPLTWQQQAGKDEWILHAGRLFDGRQHGYHYNVDIFIKNNRIQQVRPHENGLPGKVIDASTRTVIPGLFDMHAHQYAGVGEVLGRIWLSYGITSVREPGADPYDALERKESWAAGVRPGPREFFSGTLTDGERIYYGNANSIGNDTQLQLELERAVALDYDLIKTYVRTSDSLQKKITGFAHRHGMAVASHELYPAVAFGVDAVEHIRATSRRGYGPMQSPLNRSYEDVTQLLSLSGMNFTPTIALSGGFFLRMEQDSSLLETPVFRTLYPPGYATAYRTFARQIKAHMPELTQNYDATLNTIRRLHQAGAHITAGTDAPFIPYGLSLHVELQELTAAGLTPEDALRAATIHAAEALGVADDLGAIEAGKLADMVVVDGDPLQDIRAAQSVSLVIKNGLLYSADALLHPYQP